MRKALIYGRRLAVEAKLFLDNSQNCQIIGNIFTIYSPLPRLPPNKKGFVFK